MTARIFRRAVFTAVMLLLPLVCGCFDYELDMTLRANGTAFLRETLTVPKAMTNDLAPSVLQIIKLPEPTHKRLVDDQTVRIIEEVEISRLDRLTMYFARYTVQRELGGMMDMTDGLYRVSVELYPGPDTVYSRDHFPGHSLDAPPPPPASMNPARQEERRLLEQAYRGRYVTIRLRLPGEIKKARAINIGPVRVEPEVSQGEEESLVTWKLPLAALIAANARHAMLLTCDFEGDYRFSELVQQNQRSKKMKVQSNFPTKQNAE